jgi:hypothetical protein
MDNAPTKISSFPLDLSTASSVPIRSQPVSFDSRPQDQTVIKSDSEYLKKMTKLNKSILSWMDLQAVDHPLSIWKDGLQVRKLRVRIRVKI